MEWIIVLIVILVIAGVLFIGPYNSLVRLRNQIEEAWRQIDVELNRRYDLIPNLVETVKGYANFERGTLERVTELRNQARALTGGAASAEQRGEVEGALSGAITAVLATAEAYPQLKADANFRQLSDQLVATEDRIANGRRYYNALVGDYNTKVESFPSNIAAGIFKFTKAGYFEVTEPVVRTTPKVSFNDLNQSGPSDPVYPELPRQNRPAADTGYRAEDFTESPGTPAPEPLRRPEDEPPLG